MEPLYDRGKSSLVAYLIMRLKKRSLIVPIFIIRTLITRDCPYLNEKTLFGKRFAYQCRWSHCRSYINASQGSKERFHHGQSSDYGAKANAIAIWARRKAFRSDSAKILEKQSVNQWNNSQRLGSLWRSFRFVTNSSSESCDMLRDKFEIWRCVENVPFRFIVYKYFIATVDINTLRALRRTRQRIEFFLISQTILKFVW